MKITRRHFLQQTGSAGLLTALGPLFSTLSFADSLHSRLGNPEHFFVCISAYGGMDVTLGLDPQILPPGTDENDMFLEYRPEDIVQVGNLRFGPSAQPISKFASDCLILNGVMMRQDAGHNSVFLYMSTGTSEGTAPSLPVAIANKVECPMGIMINDGVFLAGRPVILTKTDDIIGNNLNGIPAELLQRKLSAFEKTDLPLAKSQSSVVAFQRMLKVIEPQLENFKKQEGELKDRHAIAAAFLSGASRLAQLDLVPQTNLELDSHSSHPNNHHKMQLSVWTEVANLFALFKKIPYGNGSLFDSTTFMVYSEFSRSPFLNASNGKDHNPLTNSLLFAGKGIARGTTLGASKLIPRKSSPTGLSEHIACPYNYKEQKLAENKKGASFFFPENVIRTVSDLFGNPEGLGWIPTNVEPIPGILSKYGKDRV